MPLTIVNWNVRWATPRSRRTPEILQRIAEHCPDIICLTETNNRILDTFGHAIWPQPYSGYPVKPGQRKIALWSRHPWRRVDWWGDESLPPGRFVAGITRTSIGDVSIIGACIPWRNSRTGNNRGKRRVWQDHIQYLDGIEAVLDRAPHSRLALVGDFNQRMGDVPNPPPVYVRDRLQSVVASRLEIVTATLEHGGKRAIDHIAVSGDLAVESLGVISNESGNGGELSDHFGVVAKLSSRNQPKETATVE